MKRLNVTVQCMAVYNSSIEVPDNMTLEEAKEILETEGFENVLDIVQDEIPVDVIEVDSQLLEL